MTRKNQPWWKNRYGTKRGVDAYFSTYAPILNSKVSFNEINSVLNCLKQFGMRLNQQTEILDGFCGNARHAKQLASLRFNSITAFDYSQEMLSRAKNNLEDLNYKVKLIRQDARNLELPSSSFELYYILGNSALGFFDDPKDDQLVLKEAYRILKPGGFFVFDLVDYHYVKKHLNDRVTISLEDKILLIRERRTFQNNGLLRTEHREIRFFKKAGKIPELEFITSQTVVYNEDRDHLRLVISNKFGKETNQFIYPPGTFDIQNIGRWVYTEEQINNLLTNIGFNQVWIKRRFFCYEAHSDRFGTMGVRNLYIAKKL